MNNFFPDALDAYERYQSLSQNEPYRNKRESFLKNYNRKPWVRASSDKCAKERLDPNFGQFKGKVDTAINVFINVLTERKTWVKICPKYAPLEMQKIYSDRITSAFHRIFIKPWEDRFMDEVLASFDIVMYGKAIEHWSSPGCLYSENVPVERVFPDTAAGMNPKKWAYVFIEKDFYLSDLKEMLEEEEEEGESFDKKYIKDILSNPKAYSSGNSKGSEATTQNKGEYSQSSQDDQVTIVYLYIKENFKSKNKISMYCFPAYVKDYKKDGVESSVRYLSHKKNYCECISNVVAVRAGQITRSYWKFNSFADQIFLATAMYDKIMSLVIRAYKRASVMYFASDKSDTQKKLLKQSDDEVQVLDPEIKIVQLQQQSNVRDIIEVVRQVMIDNDNVQSIAQSPGSQNVKGYAITAEEASLRAQKEGEQEGVSIKILMNNDVRLYKEIYRRAIDIQADSDFTDAYKAFREEMRMHNVPEEAYDINNVYFTPYFINGASQSVRIQNAQGALSALAMNPSNPGQEQAQRDLIAAFVGHENIDSYISQKVEVNPIIIKVGSENEDLDNPYVNPMNIPVLPTDKHAQELPIHISDYEAKLNTVNGIVKAAMSNPNKVRQTILFAAASDLLLAQDNKGGHIQAHIQAMANSRESMNAITPLIQKFGELQKQQDQLTEQLTKMNEEMDQSMADSAVSTEKERHLKAMNDLAEQHAKTLNDIDLNKHIEKMKGMQETRFIKKEADVERKASDLTYQEQANQLEIQQKQNEAKAKAKTNPVA